MATTIPSTATEGQDIGGFDNGVIFMVENNTWIIQQAKINYESGPSGDASDISAAIT